jgi:HPt (histidine-containing phosphotransfer) domain-containing protein
MTSWKILPRVGEVVDSAVGLFVHPHRFENEDDLWFARSAFIYTYIGMAVALTYAVFYFIFHSYGASLSLGLLVVVLLATTPMHLTGKSRLLAKINLGATSIGLAGVVMHMGGVDSSAACWLLGVTPGVTALLFRRAKEIFQLTGLTLALYCGIFALEISGYEVYHFSYPEGSLFERIYTFIHFAAFCIFIAVALAIFATTQRRLLRQVERQSREVKAILANIHQGIFTIDTPELTLGAEYSDYLEKIVEHKKIAGLSVMDLIFNHTNLKSEQKDMLATVMSSSIHETSLNFMVNESNLVREFNFQSAQGREKNILVDWRAIVNEKSDTVEKILVTLSDMTEFKRMQSENKKQQKEIEIITEITAIEPEKFDKFTKSGSRFIAESERLTKDKITPEDLKNLFISMHTFKGAARIYHFRQLTQVIHECEQYYALVQRSEKEWVQEAAAARLKSVQDTFNEYLFINDHKLKRQRLSDQLSIDLETVRENIKLLQQIEESPIDDKLTSFVSHVRHTFYGLYYMQIESLLQDITRPMAALAKELGKLPPQVRIHSVSAGITHDGCELLRNIFVHILRNSMDHGIEDPETRVSKGKDKTGTITIQGDTGPGDSLYIRYSDDGQGLRLNRIREIAVSNGLLSPEENSLEAIAEMIFHSGFSTATTVTEISGRGVGMGAVREFLEQSDGKIELVLDRASANMDAAPFQFLIVLPKNYFILYQFDKNVA